MALIEGILQGVSANFITKLIEAFWGSSIADQPEPPPVEVKPPEPERLFQTFSIRFGLEEVLSFVPDPVVHAVVEDRPSTAWHWVCLVVESKTTGEWYVSQKGEMAFEGTGGGRIVARDVARLCRERNVPLTAWVAQKSKADMLAAGGVLWPTVKPELVPLLSYAKSDYFIRYIASTFRELQREEA